MADARSRWWLFLSVAMLGVLVVGLFNLPMPFTGDQALFNLGAREIDDGAVLYRDFWDIKQPGIYMFGVAGSWVLGFSEVGWHAWELGWWLVFAAIVAVTLRRRLHSPMVAAAAPAIVVGVYLMGSRPYDLGQVEGLIAIPLYLAMWFVDDTDGPVTRRRWLASGAAGAFVLLFKHLYVLLPLAWWLRSAVRARRRGVSGPDLAGDLARLAAGFGLVLLPVAVYFTVHRQWGTIWWTYFVYAPATTSVDVRPVSRLIEGARHALVVTAPLAALALVALVSRWARRPPRLVGDLLLWLVLGSVVLLTQSWWSYHFLVLMTPLLLLGVFAADELVAGRTRRELVVASVVLALLWLPLLDNFGDKARSVVTHDFGLTASGRQTIQETLEADYRDARRETAFLREPGARPGDIYVIGNPLFLLASGRRQAIAYTGWGVDVSSADFLKRVRDALAEARPPYIFADHGARQLIAERSDPLDDLLTTDYRELRRSAVGTWYELS